MDLIKRSETPPPPGFISRYRMNNIVIVPSDQSKPNALEQQEMSEKKPINEDVNKNVADVEDLKTKKVYSWASNYLQSIGHNNLKPIKINLSSSKKKAPTETTTAAGNKEKVNPDHINYQCNANKKLDVHIQGTPRVCETTKIITPIANSCMVDTIYSNGYNAIAPAYATLLATRAGESTYYYQTEKRSIDIFDAIKSKLNCEFDIERNTRMMDLPNHKEMCENFIKEISKTKTPKKRKADYASSPSFAKREKSEHSESPSSSKKKTKPTKPVKEIEKPVKTDKMHKTKNSEADRVKKSKSQLNTAKPDIKKRTESRPTINLKDCLKKKEITNTNVKLENPRKNKPKHDHKACELRPEMTSHSSVKSLVEVPETHQSNSPEKPCKDENFDLRSKLSRVNERIKRRNYHLQRLKDSNPIINTPMDNLKITVDNQIPEKQKSPKKLGVSKPKSKKCKKLKVIINVVCKESDDDSSSNDSSFSETENNQTQNMDLSFLDDFNVDEIVDSLKDSPIKKTAYEKSAKKNIEAELKLSTVLSILNAKSESNKNKNIKTDCKAKEVMIITSSVTSTEPRLVSHAEIKGAAAEDMKKQGPQTLTQSTHPLEKLLNQNKLQLDQQNTVPHKEPHYDSSVYNYLKKEEFEEINDNVINIKDENDIKELKINLDINNQKQSQDSQKVPKCMILNPTKTEPSESKKENNNSEDSVVKTEDISIIDLTCETDDEIQSNIANITLTSKDLLIKTTPTFMGPLIKTTPTSKEPLIKTTKPTMQLPLIKTNVDLTEEDKIKTNIANITPTSKEPLIKPTPNFMELLIKTTPTFKEPLIKTTQPKIQLPLVKTNVDLTKYDKIKSNIPNIITPTSKEPLIKPTPTFMEPLVKTTPTSKEPSIKTTQPNIQLPLIKTNVDLTKDDKIKSNIPNITPTSKEPLIKPTPTFMEPLIKTTPTSKEPLIKTTEPKIQFPLIKTNVDLTKDDKIKSNITPTSNEPLIKPTPTFMEPLIKTTPTSKEPLIKTAQPKIKLPLIKTNVDLTEDDKIKSNVSNITTSKEPLIKTTPTSNEPLLKQTPTSKEPLIKTKLTNKEPNKTTLPTITDLMEKKMEENLHIKIKVIKCIRQGRFSRIFSCKDPNGQTYTAKLLKKKCDQKQEQMLTKLQQYVPQQNLNTVFLLDGFAVKTQWCFIMEFYPKTLQQALNAQDDKKSFHIRKVQVLASQLISAVMVLRNNKIIHSDINPSHILLNASQDRLKICGFDRAYYKHEAHPIPKIATTNYRAPEIILGFSAGYSVDVWASALVIFEMATNKLLFKGIFNNEILYQQMSTFGDLPWDMVQASPFQYKHFRGGIFMRRLGVRVEDSVPIHKFFKTTRLHESILLTNEHWYEHDKYKFSRDVLKLNALSKLLDEMLVLDPRKRLTAEFILLDPFIFDVI